MNSPTHFFIALFFILAGCGQDAASDADANQENLPDATEQADQITNWPRTEIGNFSYQHHVKNDGPKPQPGNIVQYNYQLFQGPILMTNTFGQNPTGTYFPTDEEAKANPKPIAEALRLMASGDSLTLISRFSTEPEGFYQYEIKVANIITLDKNTPIQKAENEAQPKASGQ